MNDRIKAVVRANYFYFKESRFPAPAAWDAVLAAIDALTPEDLAECGVEVGE